MVSSTFVSQEPYFDIKSFWFSFIPSVCFIGWFDLHRLPFFEWIAMQYCIWLCFALICLAEWHLTSDVGGLSSKVLNIITLQPQISCGAYCGAQMEEAKDLRDTERHATCSHKNAANDQTRQAQSPVPRIVASVDRLHLWTWQRDK
jgi:hypothetical protein